MDQKVITSLPENGELLLTYWKRVGGKFERGFIDKARAAAESFGFYYERGRLHSPPLQGGGIV